MNERLLLEALQVVLDVVLRIEEQILGGCSKAEQRSQCHRIYEAVSSSSVKT